MLESTTWNPVVEKAEVTENSMLFSPLSESASQIKNPHISIIKKERKKRATALYVVCLFILCLNIVFSFLFLIT